MNRRSRPFASFKINPLNVWKAPGSGRSRRPSPPTQGLKTEIGSSSLWNFSPAKRLWSRRSSERDNEEPPYAGKRAEMRVNVTAIG